jgi:hypothetical protein
MFVCRYCLTGLGPRRFLIFTRIEFSNNVIPEKDNGQAYLSACLPIDREKKYY